MTTREEITMTIGFLIGICLGFFLFGHNNPAPLGGVPTWQNIGNDTWDTK